MSVPSDAAAMFGVLRSDMATRCCGRGRDPALRITVAILEHVAYRQFDSGRAFESRAAWPADGLTTIF